MRKSKEIKTVVLYLRYSSDKQQETSIEGQDEVCSRFCAYNGYKIIGRYIDRAVSARKNVEKRVEFLRMIDDAKKGMFDAIVVYKLDRFSRDQYTTALYTKLLTENDVAILSASENLNTMANDGGMSNFMVGVMNAFAVYYSDELSQKVSRGMKITAEKCQYNGGSVPLGFKIVDKRYVIDDEKAEIVRKIFQDYVSGISIRSIIDWLGSKGIKSSKQGMEHLLANEKYIGTYRFGDIRIEHGIPSIVDEHTFMLAQKKAEARKLGPRTKKHNCLDYLLSGKIYCGHCGDHMIGVSCGGRNKKIYHYYECRNIKNGCCKKRVKKDELENLIVDEAIKLYRDKEIQEIFIRTFRKVFTKIMQGSVDKSAMYETQIEKITKLKDDALDAVIGNPALGASLQERILGYESELRELRFKLEDQKRKLNLLNITEEDVKGFLDHIFLCPDDMRVKSAIIDCMINRVEVKNDGKVGIMFNVISENCLDEIEKSVDGASVSRVLGTDDAFKVKLVDREGLEPATR